MKKFKVAICRFPGTGWERHECVDFLVRTMRQIDKDERIESIFPIRLSTTPITMARNKAIVDAKAAKCDYALMVDDDMAPDAYWPKAPMFWPTAWDFMMKRRADEEAAVYKDASWFYAPQDTDPGPPNNIFYPGFSPATVCAPYCGPPPAELVYVFHWAGQESNNPNPDWKLQMIPREMAAIMAGTQEAAALPTGLILYDMRVFDVLPPPWFRYEYRDQTESEKVTTEDVYQTRNASMLGMPQYCAWDCWSAHVKEKLVGKPQIVTRDQVHSSLREAVLRGVDSDHRLRMLTETVRGNGDGESLEDILDRRYQTDPHEPGPEPLDYWPNPYKGPEGQE
jgi:hypothetical protein